MKSKSKSKLSNLQFRKLNRKETALEIKKVLDTHLNLKLSSNTAYFVEFLGRKFLFALTSKYSNGNLMQNIMSTKAILGLIMAYDDPSQGYVGDKIVVSEPLSPKKVAFKILDLRGRTRYSGSGNIVRLGIRFTIEGVKSEGPVRTTISGTIGPSSIKFAESVMPNRIFKKPQQPILVPHQKGTKQLV